MITSSVASVDFLNITLNLKNESHKPLRIPNNDTKLLSTSNIKVTSKVH